LNKPGELTKGRFVERLRARFISHSLQQVLAQADFAGQVLSVHAEVCNLVAADGRVVALVTPPVGNGPFHVMVAARAGVFDGLSAGMTARANRQAVWVERKLVVALTGAESWEPRLAGPRVSVALNGLEEALAGLWELTRAAASRESLVSLVSPSPRRRVRHPLAERARPAIAGLLTALRTGDRDGLAAATAVLAGLGPGLTPAGDDFLVGLMAGLHVWSGPLAGSGWSVEQACRAVAEAAAPRTTVLSAAWLQAAAAGEFAEPWHQLVAALGSKNHTDLKAAADRLLKQGATSGADALAGFLAPYLTTRSR
jgi:hypothetical protein